MQDKIKICPNCKSTKKVIPIVYGMPGWELGKQAEKGKIKLGGCCIGENDPEWFCKVCKVEF